jgi:hypothetical protein
MPIPNFLICGAPKAGTTALYEILKQHPDVYMSEVKETDFFQHSYDKGMAWYESLFLNYAGQKAIGEASPGNMIHPLAAERIAHHIPDAKLIFMLRNPIERAYSQYWYGIMLGIDSPQVSFSELIRDKNDPWGQRVIELGMYAEQIKRYQQYFSADQLLILLYEDFRVDSQKALQKICAFLGINANFEAQILEKNVTRYPKNVFVYKQIYGVWKPLEGILRKTIGSFWLDRTKSIRSYLRGYLYQKDRGGLPAMSIQDRNLLASIYQDSNTEMSLMLRQDLSFWQ